MRVLNDRLEMTRVFAGVRNARSRVLFVDFDGTLAPFSASRRDPKPYPGVVPILDELNRLPQHRVVVVSGRPALELRGMLDLDPAPEIFGSHGFEHLGPDGRLRTAPVRPETRAVLEHEGTCLELALGADRIEIKPFSVALHLRGVCEGEARQIESAVRSRWRPLVRAHRLAMRCFDGGLELSASGRTKSDAVWASMLDVGGPVAASYLGDDTTDEDAFRAMRGRGTSVLVRRELRSTAADLWLRPPDELIEFLGWWRDASKGARLWA